MKNEKEMHSDIQIVEYLFRKYYKVLRAYSFRFINDWQGAENVVQDVFFELWCHRETVDFDAGIKSYLFKLVYNRSLNYLRTYPYKSLDSSTPEEKELSIYLISQEKEPGYWLMLDELDKEIQSLINQLPEQCRNVFLMSRQEEMKNREIAEKLGISVKAVEKHISKAIFFLRKELKHKGVLLLLYLFIQI